MPARCWLNEGLDIRAGEQFAHGRRLAQAAFRATAGAAATGAPPVGRPVRGRRGLPEAAASPPAATARARLQVAVLFFQIPEAALQIGAFIAVERGGAQFDEFAVLAPGQVAQAERGGGESEGKESDRGFHSGS
jgi:hypothetical protein